MTPSPEEFVRAWQTSASVAEASNKLTEQGHWHMSPRVTRRYAGRLWSRGVQLTWLPMAAEAAVAPPAAEPAQAGPSPHLFLGWGGAGCSAPNVVRYLLPACDGRRLVLTVSVPDQDHGAGLYDLVRQLTKNGGESV
jgi:hypothetical protein